MMKVQNILVQVFILILVNFGVSSLITFGSGTAAIAYLVAPITFGIMIGFFTLDSIEKQFVKSIFLGIIFLLIFIISSFWMLSISKELFSTDDALPFLSTPLSVILILMVLNRLKKIEKIYLIGVVMIISGICATLIGNYFSKLENIGFWKTFVTIPFLWQTMTGIPLLIGIKINKKIHNGSLEQL
jgi:hypothetical protein